MKACSFSCPHEVQGALKATYLSGSCAQTLLRACIWWDTFLWNTQSAGMWLCFPPANGCLHLPVCSVAPIAAWQLLLASMLHAVHPVSSDVKQQSLPTAGSAGPCLSCLILAHPCSCSVRFGMWSGARRLIAACQMGEVLLLDAPGREEPLTALDMLLNGASLVGIPATPSATILWLLGW